MPSWMATREGIPCEERSGGGHKCDLRIGDHRNKFDDRSMAEKLTLRQASEWAPDTYRRDITPHNISYLV